MKRLGFAVLLIAMAFGLGGCASSESADSKESDVSTIPWNKPQNWEGKGPLGGFAPGNGY
jgi:hypothetical protein